MIKDLRWFRDRCKTRGVPAAERLPLLFLRAVGLWLSDAVVWPALLLGIGSAVIWARGDSSMSRLPSIKGSTAWKAGWVTTARPRSRSWWSSPTTATMRSVLMG